VSIYAAVDAAIEVETLEKRYGVRPALRGVSFSVARGEIVALLGPNGAGKSTTLSILATILSADAGTVRVGGHRLPAEARAARRTIGYVPQREALYPPLTARENLRFFARMAELDPATSRSASTRVLEIVALDGRADEPVAGFSLGMRRRLNLACGMIHRPRVLLLDEPTVGVDPQSRNSIFENILALRSQGRTIVYTTHYMEEAERICDRVGIIDHGRLIAEGTRRELVARLGQHDRITLSATGALSALAAACRDIPGVSRADVSDSQVQLVADEGRRLLPAVLDAAERTGTPVRSVEVTEPDLEAVFLHLTGTALRE
jgi:ABC-2 type transport system ATP-binding protein